MKALPDPVKDQLRSCWVVSKSQKKYSSMPIDQAHEQNNKLVKGSGGAVGLTDNLSTFHRWMVAGPKQARILTEFENQLLESKEHSYQQHEHSYSNQQLFKTQVKSLSEVISCMGNQFLDDFLNFWFLIHTTV